jgi:translation initiation factor RLI1
MNAIEIKGFAEVDTKLCIGCGVCVTRCPSDAMKLVRRPSPVESQIPDDVKEHMA